MTPDPTALTEFNAGTARARAEYAAHPIAACRRRLCDHLALNGDIFCRVHRADVLRIQEARAS